MRAIILFVAEKLINNRYTKINTGSYFKRPHIKQKKKTWDLVATFLQS